MDLAAGWAVVHGKGTAAPHRQPTIAAAHPPRGRGERRARRQGAVSLPTMPMGAPAGACDDTRQGLRSAPPAVASTVLGR
jgi:hypothetical protein